MKWKKKQGLWTAPFARALHIRKNARAAGSGGPGARRVGYIPAGTTERKVRQGSGTGGVRWIGLHTSGGDLRGGYERWR